MNSEARIVTEEMLSGLPHPVQRYMKYSGVVGQPWIDTVHLKYTGQFRLGTDKPWMPMRADQVYRTDPPGFQWRARFKMFGLPLMSARDTYRDAEGHMFGKMAGLFTIFDARGEELLQGTMLRYLQEMMWFPTAYLGPYVTWQAVDDHAADVSFAHGGRRVTGRVYFDDAGRALSFIAERYGEHKGTYRLDKWSTPVTEYGTLGGLRVPTVGQGVWQLAEGDLSYVKLRVADINYNVPIRDF
ncbi:MAG: hypothetical protein JXA58_05710 [Dehalococcoidia bacterium]|nr:hypothetical protein [Dehalococcoidia bacterium]